MSTEKNDEVVLTPSQSQILPSSDTQSTNSSSVGFEALNVVAPDKTPIEDTIFGNEISKVHPLRLGKMLAFLYIKDQPLITIGPDCNYKFYSYLHRPIYPNTHFNHSRRILSRILYHIYQQCPSDKAHTNGILYHRTCVLFVNCAD